MERSPPCFLPRPQDLLLDLDLSACRRACPEHRRPEDCGQDIELDQLGSPPMPVAVTRPRRKLVVVTGAPSLLPRPDIPPQVQLLRGAGLSPGGLGHNRDGRTGTLQIMVGLLCAAKGCPLGAEVYPGETGDPMASAPQIFRVRERWGLERAVWVGDRGLLSEAGIHEELPSVEGLE